MKLKSSGKWRWIAWEEESNRLELEGVFTADDLRQLANWLDDPAHPTISPRLPVMKLKLSKL